MKRIRNLTAAAVVLLLIVGVAALFVPPPEVDNSALAWVEKDAASAVAYRQFQADFGADEVYAVRLETADTGDLAQAVERFGTVLESSPTVERVISAKTAAGPGWESLKSLLSTTPAQAGTLLDTPLNRALGLFDIEKGTALVLGLSRLTDRAERDALSSALDEARAEAEAEGLTVRIAGNPLINLALDRAGDTVERVSMPVLIVICTALLLLLTRHIPTVPAALLPAAFVVKGTDAAFTLLGITTNIVANIAKPLLFVLLLAGALHIIVGWQDALEAGYDKKSAPRHATKTKGKGVLLALLTTAVGFGSLAFSHVPPIRLFGLSSAAGLLAGAAYLLIVLPAVLARISAPKHRATPISRAATALTERGAALGPVLPVVALLVIGIGLFVSRDLVSDPHAIRYFSPTHPLRMDHEALEEDGVGLAAAEAVITFPDAITTAEGVAKLSEFAASLAPLNGVTQVISLPLLIEEIRHRANLPQAALADDRAIGRLLEENRDAVADFLSADGKQVRTSLLIRTLDADALGALKSDIHTAFERTFKDEGALVLTGNYEILLSTQAGLLQTLQSSLVLTAGLMMLLFLLFLRSVRAVLAAMIPNLFPVCLNFIVMYALSLPLDVGTSMTAAIALGIAVDDTLHFMLAWKSGSIRSAARTTGRAIILSSIIISAGFLSLAGSDFAPTRNFGILCALAMASALAADLLILPPILKRLRPEGNRKGADA